MNIVLFMKQDSANIVLCVVQYVVFEHVYLLLCHLLCYGKCTKLG